MQLVHIKPYFLKSLTRGSDYRFASGVLGHFSRASCVMRWLFLASCVLQHFGVRVLGQIFTASCVSQCSGVWHLESKFRHLASWFHQKLNFVNNSNPKFQFPCQHSFFKIFQLPSRLLGFPQSRLILIDVGVLEWLFSASRVLGHLFLASCVPQDP